MAWFLLVLGPRLCSQGHKVWDGDLLARWLSCCALRNNILRKVKAASLGRGTSWVVNMWFCKSLQPVSWELSSSMAFPHCPRLWQGVRSFILSFTSPWVEALRGKVLTLVRESSFIQEQLQELRTLPGGILQWKHRRAPTFRMLISSLGVGEAVSPLWQMVVCCKEKMRQGTESSRVGAGNEAIKVKLH